MTRSIHAAAIIAVVTLFFCLAMLAQAAVPSSLNYQGYLTDSDGLAVDGDVFVTFSIYTTDLGGSFVWSDTELVTVDQGLFSVELGADTPFPAGLFATPLWLGVTVAGDNEMLPRRPLTTVGFAFQADDALSLQGQTPAAFDQAAHVADMANPHGVDAAQAGAATVTDIASLQAQLDAALATIAALQTDLAAETAARIADVDAEAATRMAADNAEQAARMAADSVQDSVITGIQANSVLALDGVLTRPDSGTALFTAVNVQVVNGTGVTNGALNGLGNLFVGYNAPRASGSDKSGSHNLIVGDNHNYTSYGGLVGGYENTVSGVSASVSGGSGNTASGNTASVTGGRYNLASGSWSSVSGGGYDDTTWSNHAYADYSSILGGTRNITGDPDSGDRFTGVNSTISGGGSGQVTNISGSISGGRYNVASGYYASVSGGNDNTASGDYASVSGGRNNIAIGNWSSVSGGGNEGGNPPNTASGSYSSISGGFGNEAIGNWSSVSGGGDNDAIGATSSVSGGGENVASGVISSVSGGLSNTVSGFAASNGGGRGNDIRADYTVYQIGDTGPAGGLVFYVNDSGTHGLEAAAADAASGAWGCSGSAITGADGLVIGYGAQNTLDILTQCTVSGIAADIARDYSLNDFDDWFLPSKDELNLMYLNLHRAGLGDFADINYWSSSESDAGRAWAQNFNGGGQGAGFKVSGDYGVRAARAF